MTPDSEVHGANMGPTWVLSAPDGPHVGPMNLAISDVIITASFHRVACCGKVGGSADFNIWCTSWKQNDMSPWMSLLGLLELTHFPGSKVRGANMGPIWGRQDPGGPHVGPMNFAIWVGHVEWQSYIYYGIADISHLFFYISKYQKYQKLFRYNRNWNRSGIRKFISRVFIWYVARQKLCRCKFSQIMRCITTVNAELIWGNINTYFHFL